MDWKKQPKEVRESIENSISEFNKVWNETFKRDYRMSKIKKIFNGDRKEK